MSFRQRAGGRYEPEPWQNNGWGGQQMWQGGGGGQGGYGGSHGGGYGQGGYGGHQGGGYYQQGPTGMRQAPLRHAGGYQPHGYGNRAQVPHQGPRGLKRPAPHFNNNGGVSLVKRPRGARGTGGRPGQKAAPKKETSTAGGNAKEETEGFCKICQEKFEGAYNQHKLTKPHREKRGQKYPSCGPCGLKFNGDDARQRYEAHLGSKAHIQVVETAELDIKEGQEPEGTELCVDIEAVMCTLCECVFKKELVDTHCKTKGHLKRITKKKAEAERAAKKAEEEAVKINTSASEDKATDDATEGGGDVNVADDELIEGTNENEEDAEDIDDEDGDDQNGDGEEDEEEVDENADEEGGNEDDEILEDTTEQTAHPAALSEPPKPTAPTTIESAPLVAEPSKASPAKKTPARRGRARGRK